MLGKTLLLCMLMAYSTTPPSVAINLLLLSMLYEKGREGRREGQKEGRRKDKEDKGAGFAQLAAFGI